MSESSTKYLHEASFRLGSSGTTRQIPCSKWWNVDLEAKVLQQQFQQDINAWRDQWQTTGCQDQGNDGSLEAEYSPKPYVLQPTLME